MTFKNASALREAAAVVPLELMLVETDAPFLAPAAVSRSAERAVPHPTYGACTR